MRELMENFDDVCCFIRTCLMPKWKTTAVVLSFLQSKLKTGIAHLPMFNHHALKKSSKVTDEQICMLFSEENSNGFPILSAATMSDTSD